MKLKRHNAGCEFCFGWYGPPCDRAVEIFRRLKYEMGAWRALHRRPLRRHGGRKVTNRSKWKPIQWAIDLNKLRLNSAFPRRLDIRDGGLER